MVDTKTLDSKHNLTLGRMLTDVFHTCYQVIFFHLIVNGLFPFFSIQQRTPGGWDRLAEDVYSSMTSDLTSGFFSEVHVCSAPAFFFFTSDLWFKTLFVSSTCHAKSVSDKLYQILQKHLLMPLKRLYQNSKYYLMHKCKYTTYSVSLRLLVT